MKVHSPISGSTNITSRDDPAHTGPGRRFATGSNQNDHLVGAFGFLAHALLFTGLGLGAALLIPDPEVVLRFFYGFMTISVLALIVRGMQVGLTTTKESLAAIRDAWFGSSRG